MLVLVLETEYDDNFPCVSVLRPLRYSPVQPSSSNCTGHQLIPYICCRHKLRFSFVDETKGHQKSSFS